MESAKKMRVVRRALFTKALKKLSDEAAEFKEGQNVAVLKMFMKLLEVKYTELEEAERVFCNAILESELKEEDIVEELATGDEYRCKYFEAQAIYEKTLQDLFEHSGRGTTSLACNALAQQTLLPKLQLKQFGQNPLDWLSFWTQFNTIHTDTTLRAEDKFQYLIQATIPGSQARELVESYPPTAGNYEKALKSLKDRFGDEDLLKEVHARKLLDVLQGEAEGLLLGRLYDRVETQVRALETLGVTTEASSVLLYPMVASCFPETVVKAWQRSEKFENAKSPKQKVESLLDFVNRELDADPRTSLATQACVEQTMGKETSATSRNLVEQPTPANNDTDLSRQSSEQLCLETSVDSYAHSMEACMKPQDTQARPLQTSDANSQHQRLMEIKTEPEDFIEDIQPFRISEEVYLKDENDGLIDPINPGDQDSSHAQRGPELEPNLNKDGGCQSANLREELQTKRQPCVQCRKSFAWPSILAKHHRSHCRPNESSVLETHSTDENQCNNSTDVEIFTCDHCHKSFTRPALTKHLKDHGLRCKVKTFHCNQCDKSFVARSSLVSHRKAHAEGSLYLCCPCNKSFTSRFKLIEHQRTHSGRRPRVCGQYGEALVTHSSRVDHLGVHSREWLLQQMRDNFSETLESPGIALGSDVLWF